MARFAAACSQYPTHRIHRHNTKKKIMEILHRLAAHFQQKLQNKCGMLSQSMFFIGMADLKNKSQSLRINMAKMFKNLN